MTAIAGRVAQHREKRSLIIEKQRINVALV